MSYVDDLYEKYYSNQCKPGEIIWYDIPRKKMIYGHTNMSDNSMKPSENQVAGDHYKQFPIQPAEFCFKNRLNNLQSEAISYICRHKAKGGRTDLEKAIHTLEMLMEYEYGE